MDRVLRNTPTTLSVTFYEDETPRDADGAVTVTITQADGTAIVTDAATTHGATDSGTYTYQLAGQSMLGELEATWTGNFTAVSGSVTTFVEIVGGFYFALAELRAYDPVLSDTTTYTTAKLMDARTQVETEFERAVGRAFVPRGNTFTTVSGYDTVLRLPNPDVTSVLSASIDGTALTADELDALIVNKLGEVDRVTNWWYSGTGTVVITYEYGFARCPEDVKVAAMTRARDRLISVYQAVPERATSFVAAEGGTFALSTPGVRGAITGIPEVDAVLNRYKIPLGFA